MPTQVGGRTSVLYHTKRLPCGIHQNDGRDQALRYHTPREKGMECKLGFCRSQAWSRSAASRAAARRKARAVPRGTGRAARHAHLLWLLLSDIGIRWVAITPLWDICHRLCWLFGFCIHFVSPPLFGSIGVRTQRARVSTAPQSSARTACSADGMLCFKTSPYKP